MERHIDDIVSLLTDSAVRKCNRTEDMTNVQIGCNMIQIKIARKISTVEYCDEAQADDERTNSTIIYVMLVGI